MSTASPSVVLGIVVSNPLLHFRRHPFATSPSASPFCQPICLASIHIDLGKMCRRRLRDLSIAQNTPNSKEANSEQQTVIGSSNVPETLDEPVEF
ncbi:hypothetical protein V6Z12_A03G051300 [Gossypium hirsutum]